MSLKILGVRVDPFTREQILGIIRTFLDSDVPHYVVTVNPEFIIAAQKDREFLTILNAADLSLADGIGVLWAASLLAEPLPPRVKVDHRARWRWIVRTAAAKAIAVALFPEWIKNAIPARISGSDLIHELITFASHLGRRIAFVGGRRGVAHRAANALLRDCPKAHIVLADDGIELSVDEMGRLRYTESDQRALLHRIAQGRPDILFVGFGHLKQEKWIKASFRHLPGVRLFMGVGGSFDFLAGRIRRAPRFFQRHGLEWTWRWVLEPTRTPRMLDATIRFMAQVMKEKYHRPEEAISMLQ